MCLLLAIKFITGVALHQGKSIYMVNYISVISESSEHGGLNLLSGNAGSSPSLVLPVTACSEFTRSTDYINVGKYARCRTKNVIAFNKSTSFLPK